MGIIPPEDIKCWGKIIKTPNHQTTNQSWIHLQKNHSHNLGVAFPMHIKKINKPKQHYLYLFQTEQHQTSEHMLMVIYLLMLHVSQYHRTANSV